MWRVSGKKLDDSGLGSGGELKVCGVQITSKPSSFSSASFKGKVEADFQVVWLFSSIAEGVKNREGVESGGLGSK